MREVIAKGEVILEKFSLGDNPADALTKALLRPKFKHCVRILLIV